jgi:hypothetical protein
VKHDFRRQPEGPEAEQFLAWLEHETVDMLRRTHGDPEGTKTSIFLYVNRAYEAHLTDEQIGAIFGTCFARAGRPEEEQDRAFDFLEFFGQIAQATHNRT